MKPRHSFRRLLPTATLATIVITLGMPAAHAANYYWDTDGTTAGIGDMPGTWGTSAFWGSLNGPTSRNVLRGALATANTPILAADTVYFGTVNLTLGSTASTIAVVGTNVTANRIVFGAGQGTQGVTLSGGGGIITLANGSANIVANNSGTNTIGAVLAGTTGLIKGGSGTVLLTGTNSFTGGVTVAGGGTLQVSNGTSGSLTSQDLTFNNGGGVFNARAADAGSTQAMGALTFSPTGVGNGRVQSTYGTSGNAALSFTSLAARGAGATGNFVVSGGANGSTNKIVLTGAATGFLDGGLFFGGSSYAAYDATDYVRGLIYGSDTDAAAANTITNSNHVKLTSSPAARTGDTLLSLNLSGGGVNYTMNSGDLTVPAILKSGGGALSNISGGTSVTTPSDAELVIRTDTSSDLLTISSAVTGFSAGLTKTGAGTLTLSGSNGYTGATIINSGILAVSGGSAIDDSQGVTVANASGATLQLNSDETILNVTGGGISGGSVDVQGNTLTLSSTSGSTFGGTFTGTSGGGIIKQESGTLVLSQKNSFAGTTTLEGGALEFTYGNDGTGTLIALSSGGPINMADTTTLRFNAIADLPSGVFNAQLQAVNTGVPPYPYGWTVSNNINITSGTASIRVGGNENSVRFTGNVTGGASGTPTLAIIQGGIVTGSGDRQPIVFSGVIQDGGVPLGVNVDFAGASGTSQNAYVNLSGQHTFKGPISVTNSRGLLSTGNLGGYLVIGGEVYAGGHTTVVGTGYLGGVGSNYTNTISLAAGTILDYLSSANQILGGVISGDGRVLKEGSGTLTLSAANTYTGTTNISAGTLSINSIQNADGTVSAVGAPITAASGTIAIGSGASGGTLLYTGGAQNTDRVINLAGTTGGATLDQSGTSGNLKFTSNFTAAGAGSKILVLQGSDVGTGEIAGSIVNNSATNKTSVTKQGTGTWKLSGANTYTGNTVVNSGTLDLADNAQLKFVLGASTINNSISGSGTATLNGDFVIDTTAADALTSGTWTLENVTSLTGAYGSTFTVVGFVDAGGDKWTKANGAKTYTFDETTGILTLTSPGYASWQTVNGTSQTIDLDHDSDGVSNGIEYFLGGPSGNTTGFTALPGVTNTAGTLSVTWVMGSGYTGVYGTDFTVETSATLADPWTPAATGAGPNQVSISGSNVTYTFPAGPVKNFARLKVTGP